MSCTALLWREKRGLSTLCVCVSALALLQLLFSLQGASVIRMLSEFLTEPVFREGLQVRGRLHLPSLTEAQAKMVTHTHIHPTVPCMAVPFAGR